MRLSINLLIASEKSCLSLSERSFSFSLSRLSISSIAARGEPTALAKADAPGEELEEAAAAAAREAARSASRARAFAASLASAAWRAALIGGAPSPLAAAEPLPVAACEGRDGSLGNDMV